MYVCIFAGIANGGNPLVSVVPDLEADMSQSSPFAGYSNVVTIKMRTNFELRQADGGSITFTGLTGLEYVSPVQHACVYV
jgi:hypothetical protein